MKTGAAPQSGDVAYPPHVAEIPQSLRPLRLPPKQTFLLLTTRKNRQRVPSPLADFLTYYAAILGVFSTADSRFF